MAVTKRGPLEIGRCVEALIRAATPDASPRDLQALVRNTLDAFETARPAARNAAITTLARALATAERRGEQVLLLTIGALVEAGASPEIAWPAIASKLTDRFALAIDFATTAMKHAKEEHVETALEASGDVVAKKKPREAAAWMSLPARCLAGVACLIRSKKVREAARGDDELLTVAWPLSDVIEEVGIFLDALRALDDETLIILAPDLGEGWKVKVDALASNLELHLLLADALARDAAGLPTSLARPPPRPIVDAVRSGAAPKKAIHVSLPFRLLPGSAMDLIAADRQDTDDARLLPLEDSPADIPMLGDERIALLVLKRANVPLELPFEGLKPKVQILERLPAKEVVRRALLLDRATRPLEPTPDPMATNQESRAPAKRSSKSRRT